MEKKREFNYKNFILILTILILSKHSYSIKTSKQKEISKAPDSKENQKVKSINSIINFDREKGSCDLTKISEKVHFTFLKPTNVIHHLIFSTKFSYYNFQVHLNKNSGSIQSTEIEDVRTFSNTSLRKKFLNVLLNKEVNDNNFKENWLISIRLTAPVTDIVLEFFYNISNALQVDTILKTNVLKYQYINPYNYKIDEFAMKINIINYSNLNKYSITHPDEGSISDLKDGKGIVIDITKNLPEMSMYSINLPLPFNIEMCDKGFFNIISISLLFMTFIMTAFGFFTCFKISKD